MQLLYNAYCGNYTFRTDGYYDFDADFYYKQAQQEITVAELVGSEELAAQYIQYNSIYLSRGHMAANSDFLYYVQQVRLDDEWFYRTNPNKSPLCLGLYILLLQLCATVVALQR